MHHEFIANALRVLKHDDQIIGVCVAGSYIVNELDEFSDVDLIVISQHSLATSRQQMENYARSLGDYLNGFTGEHVGEPRLLICLYDNPLIHVDIKFLTLEELKTRVENPVIVFDRDGSVAAAIAGSEARWPALDFQWIEDRFWTWIHYAALKLGRGEYFEALDFLSYLRVVVLSPLMQIREGLLPRGLRKVEFTFSQQNLRKLTDTVPGYSAQSIFESLKSAVTLYLELRNDVFPEDVVRKQNTETKVRQFLNDIGDRKGLN